MLMTLVYRAVVNLPDTIGPSPHTLKIDSLMDYLSVSVGPGLVLLWKCKKVSGLEYITLNYTVLSMVYVSSKSVCLFLLYQAENLVLNLELVCTIRSSITIHDVGLMYPSNSIKTGTNKCLRFNCQIIDCCVKSEGTFCNYL